MSDRRFIQGSRRVWLSFATAVLLALFPVISMTSSASAADVGAASSAAQVKGNCAKQQVAKNVNGLCFEQGGYAGYSAQLPSGDWALGITATWTVPTIASCPQNSANDHPRTAVWVGQWGGMQDLLPTSAGGKADSWLPQIGTLSRCVSGRAVYSIGWEMAADQSGYGNAAQVTMDCPGNTIYKLCAYADASYPNNPSNIMIINPGDQILASVGIVMGNQSEPSTKAQPRKFQIYLDDMTTGIIADGYLVTAKGAKPVNVSLPAIIDQSGVIVEDQPSCSLSDIFVTHTCTNGLTLNGLAKFTTPIKITAYIAQWKQYKATTNEWVLQRDYLGVIHDQLAQNSAPSGSMTGSSGMSWTVTWLRQF
jgi:hypothetical protein